VNPVAPHNTISNVMRSEYPGQSAVESAPSRHWPPG
jgi:hypothetical protein